MIGTKIFDWLKQHWRRSALIIGAFLSAVAGLVFYSNAAVLEFEKYIVLDSALLPKETIAIVFGGGMNKDGTMTEMQHDRVMKALELYASGKVLGLLLTGDDGSKRADEINAMRALARQYGVAEDRVLIDPEGFRTYLSCYNAKYKFHFDDAIVVSQSFHLPRILYICRAMGIDAVGIAADAREYGDRWTPGWREKFARLKAFLEVSLKKPFFKKNTVL
ncbi:MAG: ElyC/SanA/YdcF family protein [Patescibacteria group bacterium]